MPRLLELLQPPPPLLFDPGKALSVSLLGLHCALRLGASLGLTRVLMVAHRPQELRGLVGIATRHEQLMAHLGLREAHRHQGGDRIERLLLLSRLRRGGHLGGGLGVKHPCGRGTLHSPLRSWRVVVSRRRGGLPRRREDIERLSKARVLACGVVEEAALAVAIAAPLAKKAVDTAVVERG